MKRHYAGILALAAALMLFTPPRPARAVVFKDGAWTFKTVIIKDPLLPLPPHENIEKMLKATEERMKQYFGMDVSYILIEKEYDLSKLYREGRKRKKIWGEKWEGDLENDDGLPPGVVVTENSFDKKSMTKMMAAESRFITNGENAAPGGPWFFNRTESTAERFRRCMPPSDRSITDPGQLADLQIHYIIEAGKELAKLKTVNGGLYFETGGYPYNSTEGLNIASDGGPADIYITNTPIILLSRYGGTSPHVLQWGGLIHGNTFNMGLMSRHYMGSRIYLSLFLPPLKRTSSDKYEFGLFLPVYEDPDSFTALWNDPETLETEADVLAHETGHLLFSLDDVTDPMQRGCIMQRDFETLDDPYRRSLMKQRGPCEIELLMARFGLARAWAVAGDKDKALAAYKQIAGDAKDNVDVLDFVAFQLMRNGFNPQARKLTMSLKNRTKDKGRISIYNRWISMASSKDVFPNSESFKMTRE